MLKDLVYNNFVIKISDNLFKVMRGNKYLILKKISYKSRIF